MNWRRVAEKMKLRHAVQLMDERETHAKEIEAATQELGELTVKTYEQAAAIAEMKRQSTLGSYSRVRIGR